MRAILTVGAVADRFAADAARRSSVARAAIHVGDFADAVFREWE
jgi:hypothetical protein